MSQRSDRSTLIWSLFYDPQTPQAVKKSWLRLAEQAIAESRGGQKPTGQRRPRQRKSSGVYGKTGVEDESLRERRATANNTLRSLREEADPAEVPEAQEPAKVTAAATTTAAD